MNPLRIVLGRALIIAVLVAGLPIPAGADGGGGGGDGGGGSQSPAKPEDRDYTAAVKAIEAEKFTTAIPLLEAVIARDGTNADAYNWMAYAVRRNPRRQFRSTRRRWRSIRNIAAPTSTSAKPTCS